MRVRILPLCSAVLIAAAAFTGGVRAQQDSGSVAERLQACLAMEDAAARLDCYDALARSLPGIAQSEASPPPERGRPSRAGRQAPLPPPPPGAQRTAEQPAAPADPRESGPAAASSAESGIDSFGLPEPRIREERPDEITLQIADLRETADGKYIFISDTQQVWRQTDTRVVPAPALPFSVEINRNFFGSYFLKINGERPAIRVERAQ